MSEKLTIQERIKLVFMFGKKSTNLLVCLVWGHLKSVVYQNRPRTLDDLKDAITTECQRINTETLNRVK